MKGVKFALFLLPFFLPCALFAQEIVLQGHVTDPQGNALPDASVQLVEHDQVLDHSTSGPHGQFLLKVKSPGEFIVKAGAPGFRPVTRPITVQATGNSECEIQMSQLSERIENVTVTADVNESDVLSTRPRRKSFCPPRTSRRQSRSSRRARLHPRIPHRNRLQRHQSSPIFCARCRRRPRRTHRPIHRCRQLSRAQ